MVLVDSGRNSEHISFMRSFYNENAFLSLKQVVLKAEVVLILSGLYIGTLLQYGIVVNNVLWYIFCTFVLYRSCVQASVRFMYMSQKLHLETITF